MRVIVPQDESCEGGKHDEELVAKGVLDAVVGLLEVNVDAGEDGQGEPDGEELEGGAEKGGVGHKDGPVFADGGRSQHLEGLG